MPPSDDPPEPESRRHPLAGARRGEGARQAARRGALRKLGPISVPEQLPAPPQSNEARIRELRELVLDTEGHSMRTLAAGYLMWLLDPLPALGPEPVMRWVRSAPVMLVARSGPLVLVFGDTAASAEGLLPLRDAEPGSAAAQRHEPFEFLTTFTRADRAETVHAVLFEPPDWRWML